VPAIVFHGDRDATVHPSNGDDVVAQLVQAQSVRPERTVEKGHVPGGHSFSHIVFRRRDGRSVAEQWIVHGGGHSWSGGSPAGSYTDPSGPDATREMVRFFLEHPRAQHDDDASV
jgi:poly(3-hydroxybutyrate) depolymerase